MTGSMVSWVGIVNTYLGQIIMHVLANEVIFFAITFFYLSQFTPCTHNFIVATAWDLLARGIPLRTPVMRRTL